MRKLALLYVFIASLCTFSYNAYAVSTDACYDTDTKLMLHMNGTDAGTTFTDSSASAHTVTANGNANTDTGQKQFGTASLQMDGSGDFLSIPDSADWFMGTGDFTIDMWVRFDTSVPVNAGLFFHETNLTNIMMFTKGGNNLRFQKTEGGVDHIFIAYDWVTNDSPAANIWYHLAVQRSGNNFYIFIDGVQKATATSTEDWFDAGVVRIGTRSDGAFQWAGWIDELRVIKGTAAFTTSGFTPNGCEYTDCSVLADGCVTITRRRMVSTLITD